MKHCSPKPPARAGSILLARLRHSTLARALQLFALAGLIFQPVTVNSYWTDSNADGVKEWVDDPPAGEPWWDEDGDGDGWANGFEVVYGSDPFRLDSDFDGITDKDEHDLLPANSPWHFDSDGDGYSDFDAYYHAIQSTPLTVNYSSLISASTPFYTYFDADGDGTQNPWDVDPLNNDRDGDGILNWQDGYMDDPYNGNGPPPEGPPPDSDNDGIPDDSDPYPWGSYWYNGGEYGGSWTDSDGDGVPDPADSFPSGSYTYNGTEYGGTWSDVDGDNVPDPADPWPFDAGSYTWNGVEYGGPWLDADNDGIPNAFDTFPEGSYWWNGTEYAGQWSDQDGDGTPDSVDSFPNGSFWYNGNEYGGYWSDADYDDVPDAADQWPNDAWNGQPHYNYNGTEFLGEWADRDSDNIPDPADSWPDDPENGLDSDGDGLSNYAERTLHRTDPGDVDTDDDFLTDGEEVMIYKSIAQFAAIDPRNRFSLHPSRLDSYSVATGQWSDTDNDRIPDRVEQHYASDPQSSTATTWLEASGDLDGDGVTNLQAYQNGWDLRVNSKAYDLDGDGITNVREDYWSAIYPNLMDKQRFEDAVLDPDQDGLCNFEEELAGSDPGDYDSLWDAMRNSATDPEAEYPVQMSDGLVFTWRTHGGKGTQAADWPPGLWGWSSVTGPNTPPTPLPPPPEVIEQVNVLTDESPHNGLPDGFDTYMAMVGPWQSWYWSNPGDMDADGLPDAWEHRYELDLRDSDDAGENVMLLEVPPAPQPDQFYAWVPYPHDGSQGHYEIDPQTGEQVWVPDPQERYEIVYSQYWAAFLNWQNLPRPDADNDGLTNWGEFTINTNPRIADSDGDGFNDGLEYRLGVDATRRTDDPLKKVQAEINAVRDLLTQFQVLQQAGTGFGQLNALWNHLNEMLITAQTNLNQISQYSPSAPIQPAANQTGTLRTKLNAVKPADPTAASGESAELSPFVVEYEEWFSAGVSSQPGARMPFEQTKTKGHIQEFHYPMPPHGEGLPLPPVAVTKGEVREFPDVGSDSERWVRENTTDRAAYTKVTEAAGEILYRTDGSVLSYAKTVSTEMWRLQKDPQLPALMEHAEITSEPVTQAEYDALVNNPPAPLYYPTDGDWQDAWVSPEEIVAGDTYVPPGHLYSRPLPAIGGRMLNRDDFKMIPSSDPTDLSGRLLTLQEGQVIMEDRPVPRDGDHIASSEGAYFHDEISYLDEAGEEQTLSGHYGYRSIGALKIKWGDQFGGHWKLPLTTEDRSRWLGKYAVLMTDVVRPFGLGAPAFTEQHHLVSMASLSDLIGARIEPQKLDPHAPQTVLDHPGESRERRVQIIELPQLHVDAMRAESASLFSLSNPSWDAKAWFSDTDLAEFPLDKLGPLTELNITRPTTLNSEPGAKVACDIRFHLIKRTSYPDAPFRLPLWTHVELHTPLSLDQSDLAQTDTPSLKVERWLLMEALPFTKPNGEPLTDTDPPAPASAAFTLRISGEHSPMLVPTMEITVLNPRPPAFPGAMGFGRMSKGGRHGKVYIVSNWNDNSAEPPLGSLRWALTDGHPGDPRTILFRFPASPSTSRFISLDSNLDVTNKRLTIAGQSANGLGVTLRNRALDITDGAEDVVVRFLRSRPGKAVPTANDESYIWAFGVHGDAKNVVLDHCSGSWSLDNVAEVHPRNAGQTGAAITPENVTLQWLLLAEPLYGSRTDDDGKSQNHARSLLFKGDSDSLYSGLYCWLNGGQTRFPCVGNYKNANDGGPGPLIDFRYNVVENYYGSLFSKQRAIASYYSDDSTPWSLNLVDNYFKRAAAPLEASSPGDEPEYADDNDNFVFLDDDRLSLATQSRVYLSANTTNEGVFAFRRKDQANDDVFSNLTSVGSEYPIGDHALLGQAGNAIKVQGASATMVRTYAGASFRKDSFDQALSSSNVRQWKNGETPTNSNWPSWSVPVPPKDEDYKVPLNGSERPQVAVKPDWVVDDGNFYGDGLPDAWEDTVGVGRFSDARWLRPQDDLDGDGFTNLEEYLNKTDPAVFTGEMDRCKDAGIGVPAGMVTYPLHVEPPT